MKSIIFGFGLAIATGVAAFAGMSVPEEPVVESSSDGNGALILLALVAVVVATGSGVLSSRNNNSLDIKADDADDNAGF